MDILDFVNIVTALSMLCSAICAATPTPKDDAIYKWLEAAALNVWRAKDK